MAHSGAVMTKTKTDKQTNKHKQYSDWLIEDMTYPNSKCQLKFYRPDFLLLFCALNL